MCLRYLITIPISLIFAFYFLNCISLMYLLDILIRIFKPFPSVSFLLIYHSEYLRNHLLIIRILYYGSTRLVYSRFHDSLPSSNSANLRTRMPTSIQSVDFFSTSTADLLWPTNSSKKQHFLKGPTLSFIPSGIQYCFLPL